jgi:hypothetical protein
MAVTILGQIRRSYGYVWDAGTMGWVKDTGSGGGGGGAVTIADGADVSLGATTDAAVAGDANGTVQSKLRYLAKVFADIWDATNHWLKVSVSYATSTATLTNVASSATNVTVVAANASRRGLTIFNDSTQALYIKFGATASLTSYTYKLFPSQTYTMDPPPYAGIIDGLWDSANGNARVTELT